MSINNNKHIKDFSLFAFFAILFFIGVYTVFHTQNSFGGADNIAHYSAAHYGWDYPYLLFGHWNKPVFTILSSPFAQFGINGVRIYNLLLGLLSAFLTFKTAQLLGLKSAFISVLLLLLAPVYFILMFTSLTEPSFSFFLILAVYLFFSDKLHWSAIVISFIPMIRNEGMIILPLFALAFALRKSYTSISLLAFGFILISLLGMPYHDGFWWQITEMPYHEKSCYGSGEWYHFLAKTSETEGYINLILFSVSFIILLVKYLRKGAFVFEDEFYKLLIIFAPFIVYFTAHSVVWAMGTGGSLGLIRVIGAVIPLMALGSVFSFEILHKFLIDRSKVLLYSIYLGVALFMFNSSNYIYKWGFYPTNREKLLKKTADYIQENALDTNFIVYYDGILLQYLNKNPYDNNETHWMIDDHEHPSMQFPNNTIIIWDSHFGNNEGDMPLKNLRADSNLVQLKHIAPKVSYKILNGYDYEIYVFQKQNSKSHALVRHFKIDFNSEKYSSKQDLAYCLMTPKRSYSPGLVVNTSSVTSEISEFQIDVSFDFKKINREQIDKITLVVSIEGGAVYQFYPTDFQSQISGVEWSKIHCNYDGIILRPGIEVLKVYIWNCEKNSFYLDNFEVKLKPID